MDLLRSGPSEVTRSAHFRFGDPGFTWKVTISMVSAGPESRGESLRGYHYITSHGIRTKTDGHYPKWSGATRLSWSPLVFGLLASIGAVAAALALGDQ